MDEHTQTEQDLSEELLQQVAGGCGACEEDKRVKKFWDNEADISDWLAEAAAARRDPRTAAGHLAQAKVNSELARLRQARIDARLGTPGHPPAPSESSISEPLAKRQRLS